MLLRRSLAKLEAGPSRIASLKEDASLLYETPAPDCIQIKRVKSSTAIEPFPIAHLPYELRQLIYAYYFASLPPHTVTCSNVQLSHHPLSPLALASSFLARDSSPGLFYRNATFSFACPEALKRFSGSVSTRKLDVRKVKVLYGRYDQPARDWVFLLASNFEGLEEVTFSVDRGRVGVGHDCFGNWWGCVRDAVREGLCSVPERGGRMRALVLMIENRE